MKLWRVYWWGVAPDHVFYWRVQQWRERMRGRMQRHDAPSPTDTPAQ